MLRCHCSAALGMMSLTGYSVIYFLLKQNTFLLNLSEQAPHCPVLKCFWVVQLALRTCIFLKRRLRQLPQNLVFEYSPDKP